MASSPTGVYSLPSYQQSSGSEGDLEQKRNKRKLSNRESAKRSRIRKQSHLDELESQVNQLKKEKQQLIANLSLTMQLGMNVEAENSAIQAQMTELRCRLGFLDKIISYIHCANIVYEAEPENYQINEFESFIMDPWNHPRNHPISASANISMY